MKKTIFIVALALLSLSAGAQQKTVSRDHRMIAELSGQSAETIYNASIFGIKSNGLYDNTASFQKEYTASGFRTGTIDSQWFAYVAFSLVR